MIEMSPVLPVITHDTARQQFSALIQDPDNEDHQAVLEYHLTGDGMIDFHRTYVPPAFRGKGMAEKLVRQGLAWAKSQGYEVRASCPYVQKFIRK